MKINFITIVFILFVFCLSNASKAQSFGELLEFPGQPDNQLLLSEAIQLNEVAAELNRQGKHQEVLGYLIRSLEIFEKVLGKEHILTASSNHNIGMTYYELAEYEEAEEYFLVAFGVRSRLLGEEAEATAQSYDSLGKVYEAQGYYSQAIDKSERGLVIRENIYGRKHLLTARSYNNVGTKYFHQGNYFKAEEKFMVALSIWRELASSNGLDIAATLNNVALVHRAQGKYPSALDYLQRALTIRTRVLGTKHLETALNYNNIGTIMADQGNYSNALLHFQNALTIQEDSLGDSHPLVAQSLNNIGSVYIAQANYIQALAYYQRALSIQKIALGEFHQATAVIYSNIGNLYLKQRNYQQAEEYFQDSLRIMEREFGKDSTITSKVYSNLAAVYQGQGRYQLSLDYSMHAVHVFEKELGKNHPDTANNYNNIGGVHDAKGEYVAAIKYYRISLGIYTQLLGEQHPETATISNNISRAYAKLRDYPNSYKFARKSFKAFLLNRQKSFSILGSGDQKERYQASNNYKSEVLFQVAKEYMIYLSQEGKHNELSVLVATTFNDWLSYKGSIMDSENRLFTFAKNTKDKTTKVDYLRLIQLRKQYSRLSIHTPDTKERRNFWQQELAALSEQINILTTKISSKDPRLQQEITLDAVDSKKLAAELPEEAVYLDYARVGVDSYILFSLDSTGQGQAAFLGEEEAGKLKNAINRMRAQNNAIIGEREVPEEEYSKRKAKKILGELRELALPQIIREQIADKEQLVISTHGVLSLLPFEALYNNKTERYLVQDSRIKYIASGRELLRVIQGFKIGHNSKAKTATIFSDPNFEMEKIGNGKTFVANKSSNVTNISLDPAEEKKSMTQWDRLPETAVEAEDITKILEDIKIKIKSYNWDDANEYNLLRTMDTDILHIATHGYFNGDHTDPMLQSGLLLAGANQSQRNRKDMGIISALKLSGLNLTGTNLVVLSACETGTVDPDATEGVSGLTRAFIQAGVDKVVMSLWKVSDGETATLMKRFYQFSGARASGYAKALQRSKISMIDEGKHPYYWAAFLLNGW